MLTSFPRGSGRPLLTTNSFLRQAQAYVFTMTRVETRGVSQHLKHSPGVSKTVLLVDLLFI